MVSFIKNYSAINICDIGSSPCEQNPFIDDLTEKANCKIIGFEPSPEEFNKLKETSNNKYYDFAIGDGKIHDLKICAAPGLTSLLEPNIEYLKHFHKFEEWAKIIKKVPVQTKKLDDIKDKFDFIKLDVQGFESEIIKNGLNKIKNSLVVQVETSPIPLYHNEKPFSYVCAQLEELGFNLHMFNRIHTKSFKPMLIQNNIFRGINHLFQLECVFIKSMSNINKLDIDSLKKMILIMHWSFKSYDLVHLLISKLDSLTKENNIKSYMDQKLSVVKIY